MKKILLIITFCSALFINAQTDSTKVENFKKTEEVLSKLVEKALLVAEKTGDFVIEQAPLLLQEFYKWHIGKSIFMIIICFIVFFVLQRLTRLCSYSKESDIPEKNRESYWMRRDGRYYYSSYRNGLSDAHTVSVIIKIFSYAAFIGVAKYLYDLIFILIAPKLYLIEYFIK